MSNLLGAILNINTLISIMEHWLTLLITETNRNYGEYDLFSNIMKVHIKYDLQNVSYLKLHFNNVMLFLIMCNKVNDRYLGI